MPIIYDEDSIWLTNKIVEELKSLGHSEAAYEVDNVLKDLEGEATTPLTQLDQQEASIPLNALAAMEVLFHLIVIRRRNFKAASEVFREVLGTELHIVNELGDTVYGPNELESMVADEQAFWHLLDTIIREWNLGGLNVADSQPSDQLTADLPMRTVARRVISAFQSERLAA